MADQAQLAAIATKRENLTSYARAHALIGSTLSYISEVYRAIDQIGYFSGVPKDTWRSRFTAKRQRLETIYKSIQSSPPDARLPEKTRAELMELVRWVFVEGYGLQGVAGASPTWANAGSILLDSVLAAPGVFVRGVQTAAKETLSFAGDVAGAGVWATVKAALPALGVVAGVGVLLYFAIGRDTVRAAAAGRLGL